MHGLVQRDLRLRHYDAVHGECRRRAALDLTNAHPQPLDDVSNPPPLVVTVCDRAHEELDADPSWFHWSVPDPVPTPTKPAFDATVAELRARIKSLVDS